MPARRAGPATPGGPNAALRCRGRDAVPAERPLRIGRERPGPSMKPRTILGRIDPGRNEASAVLSTALAWLILSALPWTGHWIGSDHKRESFPRAGDRSGNAHPTRDTVRPDRNPPPEDPTDPVPA